MNIAFEKLIQHFDEHELKYLVDGDKQAVFANFGGEIGSYRVVAKVDEDDDLLLVFGYAPLRIPEGSRPAIAETIARANYCLKIGKFEMDFDDGELRFQAANIQAEGSLTDEIIRRIIGLVLHMLDTYLPAVLSVVYGNELPKDAISCVEAELGQLS